MTAVSAPALQISVHHAPIIECLESNEGTAWDQYVLAHPAATLYHLHAWRVVAEHAYRLEAPFLVARDEPGGRLRGILPLFRIVRPFSPYMTNGLFGAYGSILADDAKYVQALVNAARSLVRHRSAAFLHLKILGELPDPLALERQDVWVIAKLDLDVSENALLRRLSSPMRAKIRHAQRAGVTFHRDPADFEAFYDVLSENMHRKGAPIYGRRFFSTLLEALRGRAEIVTLRHDGQVVSGALVAWLNGVVYVPFVSSRPSAFPLRVNNLLYWEIARMAREMGLRTLDFGTSLRGSSALSFKRSWNVAIEPVGSYLCARPGVTPVLAPADSRLARTAVRMFAALPRWFTAMLGPEICRWIA
jgi:FemAB-related protein (PEP-CTERM system-associated)